MLKAITPFLTSSVLLSCFASNVLAQDNAEIQPLTKVTYICERNVELPVVYINGLKNDESMAVIFTEGKLVPMRIWPAASGARYIALDEQDSYRWHTKGDEGVLSFLEADHEATEQILLRNCVNKDKSGQ